jgi:hypothetical protein
MAGYIGTKSVSLSTDAATISGDLTVSGTVDGRDVAADGVTADAALPKAGGAMTGAITTNSTFDGRDVAADGVTADAALPKAGGAVTGNVTFGDSNKAIFGAGSDLEIYHDGVESLIKDTGTGDLKIQAADFYVQNSGGTQTNIYSVSGGASGLSHAGANKLATTSTGISVTGTVSADGITFPEGNVLNTITAPNTGMNFIVNSGSANVSRNFIFSSSASGGSVTEKMRIDTSGNVLVGKTSDNNALEGISLAGTGAVKATNSNDLTGIFNRLSTNGDVVQFWKDGSAVGSIGVLNSNNLTVSGTVADHGGLQFGTHAVLPMEANADSNGTVDLGASGSRFKDAYLSGGVYLGGTGSANKISEYEEGNWSPTLPNGGATNSTHRAEYTRIGRMVYASYYGTLTPTNNSSSFRIGGLPFVPPSNAYGTGSIGYSPQVDTSNWGLLVSNGASPYLYFYRLDNNQSVSNNVMGGNTNTFIFWITYRVNA